MINKLFYKIINSRGEFLLHTVLKYSQQLIITPSQSNVCKMLKEVDFRRIRKKDIAFLFETFEDEKVSLADWNDLCNQTDDKYIKMKLPILLLDNFMQFNKINLVNSFLEYIINDESFHISSILLSTIMFLERNDLKGKLDELIRIYLKIVTKEEFELHYPLFMKPYLKSSMRSEALTLVSDRKRSVRILYDVILSSPKTESLHLIMNYVTEYINKDKDLVDRLFLQRVIEKISTNDIASLQYVLDLLRENNKYIWLSNMESLETLTRAMGLRIQLNTIRNLSCTKCGSHIPEAVLTRDTCSEIANALMIDVMKIHSYEELYQNSTPYEINRFTKFISTTNFQFQCVIDFPNLLCTKKRNKIVTHNEIICDTAKYLIMLNETKPEIMNICLIGKPMFSIGTNLERFLSDVRKMLLKYKPNVPLEVTAYFSSKFTKDDLLALYVALKSGPNCYIVTNDEFRDHRFLIKDTRVRNAFADWQSSRQILFDESYKALNLYYMPDSVKRSVHYDEKRKIFHIPYVRDDESRSEKTSFGYNMQWACLKM